MYLILTCLSFFSIPSGFRYRNRGRERFDMLEMTVSLKDLKRLRREGFLTEEVFARARAKYFRLSTMRGLDLLEAFMVRFTTWLVSWVAPGFLLNPERNFPMWCLFIAWIFWGSVLLMRDILRKMFKYSYFASSLRSQCFAILLSMGLTVFISSIFVKFYCFYIFKEGFCWALGLDMME